jgi:hypothetical protein
MIGVGQHAPAYLGIADDVTNARHAYDRAETARYFQDREGERSVQRINEQLMQPRLIHVAVMRLLERLTSGKRGAMNAYDMPSGFVVALRANEANIDFRARDNSE